MTRFIAALCSAAFACTALADTTQHITVDTNDAALYGGTSGGEFLVTVNAGSAPIGIYTAGQSFRTYCVELNEYVSDGGVYYVDVNTAAVGGGNGGGSPDPLSSESAWLFQTYAPQVDSDLEADAIQYALWTMEQEGDFSGNQLGADVFGLGFDPTDTVGDFIAWITANTPGGFGLGNVRVMNLFTTNSPRYEHQDLLVLVPVPGAALLGVLGLGIAGWAKRRMA